MRSILMLTFANFRKNKGQTASMLVFMLIAAALLNIGLVLFFGVGDIFDNRAEACHAAHYSAIYQSGSDSIENGLRFIEGYPGVSETEISYAVGGFGDYSLGDTRNNAFVMLCRVSETQKMDAPSLVGESLPLSGDAIYIPYFISLGGGYEIGDSYRLSISGVELVFTVAGRTEEIMFGAQFNNVHRFYVPDARYEEIEKLLPGCDVELVSARLEDGGDAVFFQADYNKEISMEEMYYDFIYGIAKQARTMVPLIASIIITAFAIILILVSLIIIRFRIANSIEENMANIGAEKAVGHTSFQIYMSIVANFAIIALFGGIAGVALSQAAIPMIMKLFEPMIALALDLGFDFASASVSALFTLAAAALISLLAARKIGRLQPLTALRGGIATHSFKKNALPLEKAHGPITLLVALKQLLQNKKQAAMIIIIVAAVTMASVAGLAVNYNMNDGRDNFARALFGEMPEANFTVTDAEHGEAFKERLQKNPEVRKVFGYNAGVPLLVDEKGISAIVVEDCSLLEGNMIIQGRYPKHSNEISLGPSILKVAGKKVGDYVTIKCGENEKEYMVTGIVQYMNQNGFNGIIAESGMRGIKPDFRFTEYNAYIYDRSKTKTFIESVKAAEGDALGSVMDLQDSLKSTMDAMASIFAAVAAAIVAVTAFVVALVLYMVIKTAILRRRRELGIQKAIGFTTLQLMNQIALNMTPIILIGVALGAVAGYFGTNPMMVAMMSGMGIVQVELPVPIGQMIAVCLSLAALSYAVSLAIAWRIRKISAYSMIIGE